MLGETLETLTVKEIKENDIVNNIYNDIKNKFNFKEINKKINQNLISGLFQEAISLEVDFIYKEKQYKLSFLKRTLSSENIILKTTFISKDDSVSLDDDIYKFKIILKEVQNYIKGYLFLKIDSEK